ncbi:TonB-dependent siderophore receptor [Rhodovibrio salinarum]|uniref:TonB-dependent siderophore receptor n=1 Tax=Rhodovibrio salinarum TaxID=1087 RepID=A0A934QLK2_9PROT|nr:TonB-dependent siderophore receptor [Rhodovibrio salinarum]MBK1699106.1 TonB-dependent siderophore receptor [Rhodovibrio salinarum]
MTLAALSLPLTDAVAADATGNAPTTADRAAATQLAASTVQLDMPAMDLGQALTRLADAANARILFPSELVARQSAPELSGRYTLAEALDIMLTGTGIVWSFSEDGTVVLESSGGDDEAALGPIVVEGDGEEARGPVDGYVASRSATGTKTDTPLIETPQAVNVVTRDQMEDQGVQSVAQSLGYTPGVVAQYGDNDLRHDWLTVRGFTPGRYLDGLRLPYGARGYSQPRIETYGLERVEVLKGPASILYGQGAPGGTVNMVKKRPTEEPIREVLLQTGSHARKQAAADLSGSLIDSGELQGRLVLLGRDSDTEFDHVDEQKAYVAPSLKWVPSDGTSLTLFAEYQEVRSEGGGGAPALPANGTLYTDGYGELPRETFVGEPDYDLFENQQWFVGYEAEHELDETFTLRQNLRYADVDVDTQRVQAFCNGTCDPSALMRYAWGFPETSQLFTVDNQVIADYATGPLDHTTLVGVDYSFEDSSFTETQLTILPGTFNAYDPQYGASVTRPDPGLQIDQTQSQLGLYAQDQIGFHGFTLTLGGRYDWAETETDTWRLGSGTSSSDQDDGAFTGRVGLTYLFDNGLAPYASYSTSFDPEGGTNRNGEPFDPTEGEQIEAGVKFQPANWNSFVTVSAYQLTRTNVLTPDPVNTSFNVQTGEVEVRGLELEGKAQLTEGLSLVGSYAYTESEITKDNPDSSGNSDEGNRLQFVPKHQASGWVDYEFQDGPLRGLGLGGGARYVGQTYGDTGNTYDIDSYTLFDAGVRYDLGALSNDFAGLQVSLDVNNVLDEKYVATCLSATGCYYGVGRTVYATLKYNW